MRTYIALLRGINVAGKNKLPMKDLVSILERLGANSVKTYIQSGNAVFRCAQRNQARIVKSLGSEIKKRHGFEPNVMVLDADDLKQAIAHNPFPEAEAEPNRLHVGFLASTPKAPDHEGLERLKHGKERYRLIGRSFYLHAPDGIGRSRLAGSAERLLGAPMTLRNWKTVCKLQEMAEADG